MADDDTIAEAEGVEAGTDTATGKKGGNLGPLIALIAVIALGVGIAWFLQDLLAPEPVTEEETEATEIDKQGPIWKDMIAVDLGEILANVKNEGGRRYVKLELQIWVDQEDHPKIARPDVRPSLIAAIQSRLRSWTMDDYHSDNQSETMRYEFRKVLDKTLRELFREPDIERTYVRRVVLNYLVQ